MKKFIFLITVIVFSSLFASKVHAQIIEKNYDRTFEVREDRIEITESKRIAVTQDNFFIQAGAEESFTIFNPIQNDPAAAEKAQQTLASIVLTDNFGNTLNFTSETSQSGNLIIKTKINTGIYSGQTYTIILKYSSYGLIIKNGAIRDVYVPGFSKNYVFEDEQSIERVTTRVTIPKIFGEINFLRPLTSVAEEGDNYVVNFNQTDLTGATAWIQIGTTQYYTFTFKQPYPATSAIPVVYNQFKIILPRDIKSGPITQTVYFTKISPEPYSTELDENGNLIASFRLPVNQEGEIVAEGYAVVSQNNDLSFTDSGSISQIPSDILDANTKSAKFWEADATDIVEVAAELKDEETNVYTLVERAYKYVVDQIDYSEVKKFGLNQRQGALATLRGGAAVCMEYSDLFIAILRAMGLPARAAFGTGYSTLDGLTSSVNTVSHQWAEVYIPSIDSWVQVDTTWGENGDTLIGGDLNHFYTHVASVDPETPASTEALLYGRGGNLSERQISVSALNSRPSEESLTMEQVLQKYPKKDTQNIFENIFAGVSLFVSSIDSSIDELFDNMGASELIRTLIKIIFAILLIVLGVFIVIRKRKIKINEATHRDRNKESN